MDALAAWSGGQESAAMGHHAMHHFLHHLQIGGAVLYQCRVEECS